MDQEKTLKLVTNLDRAAIEQQLGEVRAAAQSKGLDDLAGMFAGIEGAPRAQLEQKVDNALRWLASKPEHIALSSLLELVELNLPNLK
jgi:hypothetical protein